jgi:hypothetical protein
MDTRSMSDRNVTDEQIEDVVAKHRPVLDKLAGVGRKVVDICPDCQHEIDEWDLEDGREHVCPPTP